MLSRVSRLICLLILLCLALPRVQATPLGSQSSVYLAIVQRAPVLSISEPIIYGVSRGGTSFIGEVINMSETQAFSVTLRTVVYQPFWSITTTEIFSSTPPVILPQQRAPYGRGFSSPPSEPPIVRSISVHQIIPTSPAAFRRLTIIPQTITCDPSVEFGGHITGSVRNDNTVPVNGITIAAWIYHNDAAQFALAEAIIAGPLAPGTEQAFATSPTSPLCDWYGKPMVTIDAFQYAAQGTVVPSP